MGQFNFGDFAHFYIGGNTAGVLFVPTPCTRARLRRFSRWGGSLKTRQLPKTTGKTRGGVCHQSRENSAETAKTPPVLPVPGGRRAAAKMPGDGDEQHRLRLLMFGHHEQSSNFKLRHYPFWTGVAGLVVVFSIVPIYYPLFPFLLFVATRGKTYGTPTNLIALGILDKDSRTSTSGA